MRSPFFPIDAQCSMAECTSRDHDEDVRVRCGKTVYDETAMSTTTNGRPAAHTAGTSSTTAWSVHDASELYEVPRWSNGYFSVSAAGHMQVHPTKEPGRAIDLK